jgi:hypothetical protein
MLNLYWKSDGQTRSLIEAPFKSEQDFEKYVYDNQDILGNITIIHRQIRTGNKQGIPDMLAVDQNKTIYVIELKNAEATEDILPQALGYAIWAETNPDSIRAIWLESKNRPENIELDWDNLDIRIMLVAPDFKETVPRMAARLGFPVDLIRIRRYSFETEEFLLAEVLEEKKVPRPGATTVMGDWTWEFYESEHGKDATAQFRKAVQAIDGLAKKQSWNTVYNLNKYYTGFKLGNRVVFSVSWGGTYAWQIHLKLPEKIARSLPGENWEMQRYDSTFHEAVFRPRYPDHADIAELEALLVEAYNRISGRN